MQAEPEAMTMPRRRTVADRDRDAQAVDLRRQHMGYKQIAAALGYASVSSAYEAVQRGMADYQQEASDEVRRMELERLDDLARGFREVFDGVHYVASVGSGKVVLHPDTNEPLIDHGPRIQAGLALLRVMERRAKYLGLDAPRQVEVRAIDAIDARLLDLAEQVAAVEPASAAGVPRQA